MPGPGLQPYTTTSTPGENRYMARTPTPEAPITGGSVVHPSTSKMEDVQIHDGSALSYPHKTDIYSFRVPTPPRIVVPPPILNADSMPDITLHALRKPEFNFLNNVDYHNLIQQNAPLEWAYERRREAQGILPFLFLGPMTAAKDEAWLQREGITMVLSVCQKNTMACRLMKSALRGAESQGIELHNIEVGTNQDLIQGFPGTTNLINGHLARRYEEMGQQSMGKVLVICESGNERSAGVVAAYVMETHEDFDYIQAMQLCQAQRFCVNFDDGMKRLLQGYWDILCARRAVVANHPGGGKAKRTLERDEEEERASFDPEAMQSDDMERFGGRNFAPFMDAPL